MFSIFLLFPALSFADVSIGKYIRGDGYIKRENINCTGADCSRKGHAVYPGERIKTSGNSRSEILLNDGTALLIYGNSDVIISGVRMRERDKPTEIFLGKGKITIIQKNSFMDTSLIVKTPASIIKSVNSEINIVTGSEETAVFVYSGEAGFAGVSPSRDKAFILNAGCESFVKKEESPAPPVKVQRLLRGSWLGRHILSDDARQVLIYKKETGPVDWPFIKND